MAKHKKVKNGLTRIELINIALGFAGLCIAVLDLVASQGVIS